MRIIPNVYKGCNGVTVRKNRLFRICLPRPRPGGSNARAQSRPLAISQRHDECRQNELVGLARQGDSPQAHPRARLLRFQTQFKSDAIFLYRIPATLARRLLAARKLLSSAPAEQRP